MDNLLLQRSGSVRQTTEAHAFEHGVIRAGAAVSLEVARRTVPRAIARNSKSSTLQ